MPVLHRTQAEAKARRMKAAEVTLSNYYENLLRLEYAMEALESIGYQPRAARRMLSRVTALKAPSTWRSVPPGAQANPERMAP